MRRILGSLAGLVTLVVTSAYTPGPPPGHRPLSMPPSVPREFRAAWVSPVFDMGLRDWPSKPGLSPDSQRAELRAILDKAQAMHLNAVILHVRVAGDALYPTKFAPWSDLLTGKSGVGPQPAYDPLAFAITEAHARGLQLHAWFNPFRAELPGDKNKMAKTHVTRAHDEWIRHYGKQTWIDPGDPNARKEVLATILDVVKRYDVDGIHLDDYFYPYREYRTVTRRVNGKRVHRHLDIDFPDNSTWKKYGKARGWIDRADWRRENIDNFIHALYDSVKAIKPTVLVGVSPFGIWRSGTPDGVTGLDAYGEIYADSRRWLADGWVDYLAPQLYWAVDGEQDRFRALDAWWQEQNPRGRHIWPGLAAAKVVSPYSGWTPAEMTNEIRTLRGAHASDGDQGHVLFRLSALLANDAALAAELEQDAYADPALVPASPWLGRAVPASPRVSSSTDGLGLISLTPGDSVAVRWWLVQARGSNGAWTTVLRPSSTQEIRLDQFLRIDPDEIAVRAVSPTGALSAPVVVENSAH